MATTAEIAKRYFAALSAHDLDAAVACWAPGAIDRMVGGRDLVAPEGIREYFGELFAGVPRLQHRGRRADHLTRPHGGALAGPRDVRGPRPLSGFRAQRRPARARGLRRAHASQDDLIRHNDAYLDSGDIARQLGVLPPAGSPAEARLTRLANAAHAA